MNKLLIFGLGYTASRLADACLQKGWQVRSTKRSAGDQSMAFDDSGAVHHAIAEATHILSSVPPGKDCDAVLARYGDAISGATATWSGYLSSTGVYGDAGGAWVDESASIGQGRRTARSAADLAWQKLRSDMRVLRLPGIYGPGRSVLERIQEGKARRIDLAGQVFSRIHVDDIVSGIIASMGGPAGVYNLADDCPAPQNAVIEYGCDLIDAPYPPLQTLDEAGLSDMARGFYSENRRVSNLKAKKELGWAPKYRDYRSGLHACADIAR